MTWDWIEWGLRWFVVFAFAALWLLVVGCFVWTLLYERGWWTGLFAIEAMVITYFVVQTMRGDIGRGALRRPTREG